MKKPTMSTIILLMMIQIVLMILLQYQVTAMQDPNNYYPNTSIGIFGCTVALTLYFLKKLADTVIKYMKDK